MPKRETLMRWLDDLTSSRNLEDDVEQALHELRLAQDLIALREKRGLTQAALAARLGVTQPFIAKIESGRAANLQLKTLIRLVTALGGSLVLKVHDEAPARVAVRARSSKLGGSDRAGTGPIGTAAHSSSRGTRLAGRR